MTTSPTHTSTAQNIVRMLMGLAMIFAGIGHLTFARIAFQAQVPDWVPLDKDLVVLLSGVVEIAFGLAMAFWTKRRMEVGIALAIFYVLVFPGNMSQYVNHRSAFGLDTDQARLVRLFFQPVLIFLALWSTGVFMRKRKK